eukprot:EG_transcript_16557
MGCAASHVTAATRSGPLVASPAEPSPAGSSSAADLPIGLTIILETNKEGFVQDEGEEEEEEEEEKSPISLRTLSEATGLSASPSSASLKPPLRRATLLRFRVRATPGTPRADSKPPTPQPFTYKISSVAHLPEACPKATHLAHRPTRIAPLVSPRPGCPAKAYATGRRLSKLELTA